MREKGNMKEEHEGIIALRRASKNMRKEYGELLGT